MSDPSQVYVVLELEIDGDPISGSIVTAEHTLALADWGSQLAGDSFFPGGPRIS